MSVVAMASILMGLNVSTLNVALPEVVRHFDAGAGAASWVLLSFMLAQTVLLLLFGRLTDMIGRRTMYLIGLSTFTLASILLGFSPTVSVLIVLRVVQAAGSAMLLANSAAFVTDAFPPRLLAQGMGVYLASFSVAQLVGPSLGGFLADAAGWRWVFWFNVPVGVVGLLWGASTLQETRVRERPKGVDLPGNVLLLLGLGSLLIGLSEVGRLDWTSPLVLGGFGTFAAIFPIFFVVERRRRYPLVDLALFRQRFLSMPFFASFANSAARFSMIVILALFFQAVDSDNTLTAGLKILPLPVATMVASASAGLWTRWISSRSIAIAGMGITVFGMVALYPMLSETPNYRLIGVSLVIIGFGSGIFQPANTTGIMEAIPPNRVGIANATRLVAQNVGLIFGTAMSLTLVSSLLGRAASDAVFAGTLTGVAGSTVGDLITGYHRAIGFFIAICTLGLISTILAQRSAANKTRVFAKSREGTDCHECS